MEESVVDVNGFHGSVEGRAVLASAPHCFVRPDGGLTTARSTEFRQEFCHANVFAENFIEYQFRRLFASVLRDVFLQ